MNRPTDNEGDAVWLMLTRIENNQAKLGHEIAEIDAKITVLRADMAMLYNTQNQKWGSQTADTKKKSTESPALSRHSQAAY